MLHSRQVKLICSRTHALSAAFFFFFDQRRHHCICACCVNVMWCASTVCAVHSSPTWRGFDDAQLIARSYSVNTRQSSSFIGYWGCVFVSVCVRILYVCANVASTNWDGVHDNKEPAVAWRTNKRCQNSCLFTVVSILRLISPRVPRVCSIILDDTRW